jgi:hypothetical protein
MHANRTLAATVLTLALAFNFSGCKQAAPAPNDASMTAALQTRLTADAALSSEPIQSSVENRIATLNGTVSSEAARSLAAADAAQVNGVKTVVNNLIVQPVTPTAVAAATPPPAVIPALAAPSLKKTPAPKLKPSPALQQPAQQSAQQPAPIERPVQEAANVPPPPPPPLSAAPLPSAPAPLPSAPEPKPAFRNITIPPDTTLPVRVTETLDSGTSQQGDTFTGSLATDLVIDGIPVLRQGTPVYGRVVDVQEAAHYKGSSLLSVELTAINRHGERVPIATDPYTLKGKGRGANTAEKVGGGAAVGAILGGIIGGGKGAAIGAAAGGGAGAGVNTITRGEEVQITSETLVRFQLTNALLVRVPTGNADTAAPNPELQQRPANPAPQ